MKEYLCLMLGIIIRCMDLFCNKVYAKTSVFHGFDCMCYFGVVGVIAIRVNSCLVLATHQDHMCIASSIFRCVYARADLNNTRNLTSQSFNLF